MAAVAFADNDGQGGGGGAGGGHGNGGGQGNSGGNGQGGGNPGGGQGSSGGGQAPGGQGGGQGSGGRGESGSSGSGGDQGAAQGSSSQSQGGSSGSEGGEGASREAGSSESPADSSQGEGPGRSSKSDPGSSGSASSAGDSHGSGVAAAAKEVNEGSGDALGAAACSSDVLDAIQRRETTGHDISDELKVTRKDKDNVLHWRPPPANVTGFQIWRSNSPFVLVAEVPATETSFTDANAPESSKYKVTYFTGATVEEGYAAAPEHLPEVDGWVGAIFSVPEPSAAASSNSTWLKFIAVLEGSFIFVAGVFLTRQPFLVAQLARSLRRTRRRIRRTLAVPHGRPILAMRARPINDVSDLFRLLDPPEEPVHGGLADAVEVARAGYLDSALPLLAAPDPHVAEELSGRADERQLAGETRPKGPDQGGPVGP